MKTITELDGGCLFPVTEAPLETVLGQPVAKHMFCGCERLPKSPYCVDHHLIAYNGAGVPIKKLEQMINGMEQTVQRKRAPSVGQTLASTPVDEVVR